MEKIKQIYKEKLKGKQFHWHGASYLDYWVGTTGECGGNSKYGGRTGIIISNVGCGDYKIILKANENDPLYHIAHKASWDLTDLKSIELWVGGDEELIVIKKICKDILEFLENTEKE